MSHLDFDLESGKNLENKSSDSWTHFEVSNVFWETNFTQINCDLPRIDRTPLSYFEDPVRDQITLATSQIQPFGLHIGQAGIDVVNNA